MESSKAAGFLLPDAHIERMLAICRDVLEAVCGDADAEWPQRDVFVEAVLHHQLDRDLTRSLEYLFTLRRVVLGVGLVSSQQVQQLQDFLPERVRRRMREDRQAQNCPMARLCAVADAIQAELHTRRA